MSEGAFIVLVLLVFGGYYVFDRVWDAGASKLNRSVVMPKSHAAGQRLVTTELVARTPLPPPDLMAHLDARVAAVRGQPAGLKGQLYCTASDATGANYAWANSLGTTFTAEVDVRPQGDGSEAVFRVLTWQETEGIVDGIDAMELLAADVRDALASADPAVSVSERPVQHHDGQQHHDGAEQGGVDDAGLRPPPPEPSALAFSSFPGLEQAHALGPLAYQVMWEALSRPDGVRRSTLSVIIDRPRAEVDAALETLREAELVDMSSAGLIRSRKAPA